MAPARSIAAYLALACALLLAACGSDDGPSGMEVSGPGLQQSAPPWKPEYVHLKERIRQRGLPPAGTEKYHEHALLRIYVDGRLSPIPNGIGVHKEQGIESGLHTHDAAGIVHMEASKPHRFTLGDFFAVWGVKLGPDRVGALTGLGGDKLHFFVNGKTLRDPAAYVLRPDDSIVIGYGPLDSFPREPSTELLEQLKDANGDALSCSKAKSGKKVKSCFAPESSAEREQRGGAASPRPRS